MHVFSFQETSALIMTMSKLLIKAKELCCVLLLLPLWLGPVSLIPLLTVREDVALEEGGLKRAL